MRLFSILTFITVAFEVVCPIAPMSGYELALKGTLLCVTGLAVHISLSPPNPPVKDQNCSVPDTLFERFVQSITFFSKVLYLFLIQRLRHRPQWTSYSVHRMGGGGMGHLGDVGHFPLAYLPSSIGFYGHNTTHLSRYQRSDSVMDDAPSNVCWHDCHCRCCGFKDMVSTLSIANSIIQGTLSFFQGVSGH